MPWNADAYPGGEEARAIARMDNSVKSLRLIASRVDRSTEQGQRMIKDYEARVVSAYERLSAIEKRSDRSQAVLSGYAVLYGDLAGRLTA